MPGRLRAAACPARLPPAAAVLCSCPARGRRCRSTVSPPASHRHRRGARHQLRLAVHPADPVPPPRPGAEPRMIAARGELAADEKATIDLFQARRDSVVYISTAERVVDPWTRNVHEMPRGTGSGFVWDDLGHVVTNNHVIQGASRASCGWPTGAPSRPSWSAPTRRTTSPCCASGCRRTGPSRCRSAAAPTCRSARRSSPSATRSGSTGR